jgi:uncharacterized protein (TIGR00255 family)
MLRSMTGFGKGVSENRYGTAKIEIKSLNYKFFEVASKLPPNLAVFDDKIREALQKKISRGRLNLFLSYEQKGKNHDEVFIDKKIARQYYSRINELKKSLGLAGEIETGQLIALPGIVAYRPHKEDIKHLWPLIRKALDMAADDLVHAKTREGRMLKRNIASILKSIEASLLRIKKRAPGVVKEYKSRMLNNVKDLTNKRRVLNHGRMEEEAAIFARNCDISEEIHREAAHIAGFRKILAKNGEAGRRLDFIAQEMHREANTIGAKANDFPISKEVIKIKSLIEKIREQVQNVE